MNRVTIQALLLTLLAGVAGVQHAQAQCVQTQGNFTAELLLDGANSDGTFTYVWGVTFRSNSTWLTDLWFQSAGAAVTSSVVQPQYTTWTRSQVAEAPGTGQPAEYYTFNSGFKLQRGRQFTFAYTTDFTDPVQVRAVSNNGTVYTAGFTSATCGNLPVELTSFDARADGGAAAIAWTTASETNNAGFHVEMKAPGAAGFTPLEFVPGHGTTAEAQQYAFRTGTLAPGRYTFRLQQVDFDGATDYSDAVEVEIASGEPLYVQPFATTLSGATAITFTSERADFVRVSLYNALGQQVAALFAGDVAAGQPTQALLDASRLPSGAYFLRLQGSTSGRTTQVTVVR